MLSWDRDAGELAMRSFKCCEHCRRRKIKCDYDGWGPCKRCRLADVICIVRERKKPHDKIFPNGDFEMVENQQSQMVTVDMLSSETESLNDQPVDPAPLRPRYGAKDFCSKALYELFPWLPADGVDRRGLDCSCSDCHQRRASHFISIHSTASQEPGRNIQNDESDDTSAMPPWSNDGSLWKLWTDCEAAVAAWSAPRFSSDSAPSNTTETVRAIRHDTDLACGRLEHKDIARKRRLLAMVEPSSIHDPETAIRYANTLKELSDDHYVRIIMRKYLEKPRTTTGWKGLINDPDVDQSFRINKGFRISRQLYSDLANLGMPIASEMLYTISPQFLAELLPLGTVSACSNESQLHTLRQLYSDLTMGMPTVSPGAAKACFSRRGRGGRKNRKYWNLMANYDDLFNPFERDCLFGNDDGGLTIPATSYMDSTCRVPRCMSRKYLQELGLESKVSTDFDDPGLISICMGGQTAKVTGIVRDISFRIKGSSMPFKGDFFVSEMLENFYDVLFGRQFICNEAAEILEKALKIYREAKGFVGRTASKLSAKIGKVASEVQTRVSDFFSGISSPPPPPYSLVNVLEGDFLVIPRLI